MTYLLNTFTPMMLGGDSDVRINFLTTEEFVRSVKDRYLQMNSAVSHELTAELLTRLVGVPITHNRVNITLLPGDIALGATPLFRAEQAREFTQAELESAAWKFWRIEVR